MLMCVSSVVCSIRKRILLALTVQVDRNWRRAPLGTEVLLGDEARLRDQAARGARHSLLHGCPETFPKDIHE